jgi:hypothetical protein
MRARWLVAAWAVAGPGCVDEHDVDVFVVLPQISGVCGLAGVARADLALSGPGPEAFQIRSDRCGPIGDGTYDGFQQAPDGPLRFERLAGGFFELTVTLRDADGAYRGHRTLPFDARTTPLVIPMDRADVDGWQTERARVAVPTCAEARDLASVTLTLTPDGAARPLPDATIDCAAAGPQIEAQTEAQIEVPRGPLSVHALGRLAGGAVCYEAMLDAVVDPAHDRVILPLTRTCP